MVLTLYYICVFNHSSYVLVTVVALGGTPTRGQHSPTGGVRHQGLQPLPQRGMWRKLAVLLHLDSLG